MHEKSFIILMILTFSYFYSLGQNKKVKSILNDNHFAWKKDTIGEDHFKFYYEENSWAEVHKADVKKLLRRFYHEISDILSITSYPYPIYFFITDSRAKTKYFMGNETNGAVIADKDIYFVVANDEINGLNSHEFFHGMAYRIWGPCHDLWINEGLAVASTNDWNGYDLHALTHFLLSKEKLIPLADLILDFRKENNLISYPEAGSFMKYILQQYGSKQMAIFWKGGVPALEQTSGKKITDLEKEWLQEISKYDTSGIQYTYSSLK